MTLLVPERAPLPSNDNVRFLADYRKRPQTFMCEVNAMVRLKPPQDDKRLLNEAEVRREVLHMFAGFGPDVTGLAYFANGLDIALCWDSDSLRSTCCACAWSVDVALFCKPLVFHNEAHVLGLAQTFHRAIGGFRDAWLVQGWSAQLELALTFHHDAAVPPSLEATCEANGIKVRYHPYDEDLPYWGR